MLELGQKAQRETVSHPRSQAGGLGQASHGSATWLFALRFPGSLQQ